MKYVFIDMDGVIAEYGYADGTYGKTFKKGNYLNKKPIQIVIDNIIKKFNNSEYIMFVCSASPNAKGTLEKNDWLNRYFNVPYENRIFISPEENKVEVIKFYMEELVHGALPSQIILIDDKGTILQEAQAEGIKCYHPTQFISMIEEEEKEAKEKTEKEANDKAITAEEPVEVPQEMQNAPVEIAPEIIEEVPNQVEEA